MNFFRKTTNHFFSLATDIIKKHTIITLCVFVCCVVVTIVAIIPFLHNPLLHVSFLDIGQGDAILIKTPNHRQVLIDAGPNQIVVERLGKGLSFFDKTIDIAMATHSDADHVGGFPYVFDRYNIPLLIESEIASTTTIDRSFTERFLKEKSDRLLARAGERIVLDQKRGIVIDVLFPDKNPHDWETNEASMVIKLSYGSTAFILSGDAPAEVEDHLVRIYNNQLQAQVLKLGHHGSKTSTSEQFLDTIQPEYAIVSAGLGNKYGHPNAEIVERVTKRGINIKETSVSGTIRCVSDGKTVSCTGER